MISRPYRNTKLAHYHVGIFNIAHEDYVYGTDKDS